jgi:hypothetical protein
MDEYDRAEEQREFKDDQELHDRLDQKQGFKDVPFGENDAAFLKFMTEEEAHEERKKMREMRYGGIGEDVIFENPEDK